MLDSGSGRLSRREIERQRRRAELGITEEEIAGMTPQEIGRLVRTRQTQQRPGYMRQSERRDAERQQRRVALGITEENTQGMRPLEIGRLVRTRQAEQRRAEEQTERLPADGLSQQTTQGYDATTAPAVTTESADVAMHLQGIYNPQYVQNMDAVLQQRQQLLHVDAVLQQRQQQMLHVDAVLQQRQQQMLQQQRQLQQQEQGPSDQQGQYEQGSSYERQ